MNKRILTIAACIALLTVLAVLCFGGCGGGLSGCAGCLPPGGENVVDIGGATSPDTVTEAAPGENTASPTGTDAALPTDTSEPTLEPSKGVTAGERDMAFVRANSTGTYGVASDGSVRFMGRSTSGQHLVYDWRDTVDLAVNDTTAAAAHKDGTVTVAGKLQKTFAASKKWADIRALAMGDKHLAGLEAGGTVVACGNNENGCCDVSGWTGVKKIAAGAGFTAALTEQGVVTTLGGPFDSAVNAKPVSDIAAAGEHLVVLYSDGTVMDHPSGVAAPKTYDWSGIIKVYAAPGAAFGIDAFGNLFTDSRLFNKQVKDAYCVAASEKHAVVLHGSGKCESFGENGDLQGGVGNWRLLPYVSDEGWLFGLNSGMKIDGSEVATGKQVIWTEPATGDRKRATCVLLGDVNGDGKIGDPDVDAVNKHISGELKLTDAYGRAANAICDSSKPNSVDIYDLELITAEAAGKHAIDQYVKSDPYSGLLADAKRRNPDAVGYITIKGTNISYPIMYDREWFYNDHDINRQETVRGSIYFYWSKANKNIVITGHNSRVSGTMFHQLHDVQNSASKLKDYKNRLWQINTYGSTGYWEVWAMYEEPGFKDASKSSLYYNTCWPNTFNALNDQQKQDWINYQLKKNELKYNVKVTTDDRFMTIVTCGDDHAASQKGARLYFFLRYVGHD